MAPVLPAGRRGYGKHPRCLSDMGDFVAQRKLAFVPNPLRLPNGNGNGHHGNGHRPNKPATTAPFVLTVGRLVEDKAQDILLDAFAQTGEAFKDWRLAIVGEGRLGGQLRAQAKALGIAERVDWHGIVPILIIFIARRTSLPCPRGSREPRMRCWKR